MSTSPSFSHLLVLPHLCVQNANAVSSALTHGFPSMTAFLGLMWALERKARAVGLDMAFNAVGVVCHDHQEQVTEGGFVKTFRLTRNPVGKDGGTAAIVEEGRIHLDLSLLFAVSSQRWLDKPEVQQQDIDTVAALVADMRVAGGTLLPPTQPWRHRYRSYAIAFTGNEDDRQAVFRKVRLHLLPGFTLVARDDLLDARLAELHADNANATRLDAWLSLSRVNWHYQPAETDPKQKHAWTHDRTGRGWIVPMPIGYGALGQLHEAGTVTNARDGTTPFRFVESLYSMGQWISPHRLHSLEQLLWYADSKPESGMYRCRNDYQPAQEPLAFEYDFD
jgi:CRISPR-associated protein Csy2